MTNSAFFRVICVDFILPRLHHPRGETHFAALSPQSARRLVAKRRSLIKRIIWRMHARRRAVELANDADLRVIPAPLLPVRPSAVAP